jgi:hypothetical protein
MIKTRLCLAIVATFGLCIAGASAEDSVAEATYEASVERAGADHKVALAKCDALEDNAEDVCEAEAELRLVTAKAKANARHENTAEARAEARVDIADAELALAKQKCDNVTGNEHDVCVKQAELKHTSATTAVDANEEVATAVDERAEKVQDAEYTLAMEKCEPLRGDAQTQCEEMAKAQHPEPH